MYCESIVDLVKWSENAHIINSIETISKIKFIQSMCWYVRFCGARIYVRKLIFSHAKLNTKVRSACTHGKRDCDFMKFKFGF